MIECAIAYALIDYLGYGIVQDEQHNASLSYRVFQAALWIPIMFYLDTWYDRIGFFILWWTFVLDWLYYVFTIQPFMDMLARALRLRFGFPRVGWDDWEDTESDFKNGISHAYWTPIGILAGFKKNEAISIPVLVIQSFVGVYLVL